MSATVDLDVDTLKAVVAVLAVLNERVLVSDTLSPEYRRGATDMCDVIGDELRKTVDWCVAKQSVA